MTTQNKSCFPLLSRMLFFELHVHVPNFSNQVFISLSSLNNWDSTVKVCVLHYKPICPKGNWKILTKIFFIHCNSLRKLQACSLTSAPFSPGQGSIPYENNSSTVIPKAHTSEAWENLRNLRTSWGHLKRTAHNH